MRVSDKYLAFMRNNAKVEFLEGTTASGKTTVGVYKFLCDVARSEKSQHILSGLDRGTIEKNIINAEHGILDEWGELVVDAVAVGREDVRQPVVQTVEHVNADRIRELRDVPVAVGHAHGIAADQHL